MKFKYQSGIKEKTIMQCNPGLLPILNQKLFLIYLLTVLSLFNAKRTPLASNTSLNAFSEEEAGDDS